MTTNTPPKVAPDVQAAVEVILYIDRHHSAPSAYGDVGRMRDGIEALIEAIEDSLDAYKEERKRFINSNPRVMIALATSGTSEQEEDDEFDADFLEFDQLATLPKPEWLIYNILPTKGINFLVSAPKVGKTYIAVSWGCTVALEPSGNRTKDTLNADILNWCGRATRHGHVIYVAAEDIDDIAQRAIGWAKYHHIKAIPHMHFFKRPLQIKDEHERFMNALDRRYKDADIKMIIIDTLAMCTSGIEENSKKEFDNVIRAVEMLWRKYNCCILIVHHEGRNGKIRGTSSLDGVAYTLMDAEAVDDKLVLKCTLKRRGKKFDDIYLDWQTVELGYLDEEGNPATASVVTRSDFTPDSDGVRLTKLQQNIVDVIIALGSKNVARRVVMAECHITEKQERSFRNAINALINMNILVMEKKGRESYYSIISDDTEKEAA